MVYALYNKITLTLAVEILGLLSVIANADLQCSQNALNKEDIVCKNVMFVKDLRRMGQEDWKQLKIINEKTKDLNWDAIPEIFTKLENLDISQVGELILTGDGFNNLPNLKTLNVSGCKIKNLIELFSSDGSKLQNLDASWNSLEVLNFSNNMFPSLEVANFSHNAIQTIEMEGALQAIKVLNLDYNELRSINLHELRKLKVLTIRHNLLKNLTSNSFKNVPLIEELIITYCALNNIADHTFADMKELKKLNLSGNSLEELSPEVFAGLNRLLELDLNSNNLIMLADLQFQHLVKLQYLDISRNSLKLLNSSNFNNLSNLRKLFIYENDIEEVKPYTFANLVSLDTLDLSYNNIEQLDADIFGAHIFPRMRKLLIKSNNLKHLHPLAFASLPFLQYLSLGFNEITSLDVRMFSPMRRLEKLHLGNNLLETIPSEILESLTDVTELLLDNNRLSFLSNSNATFAKLEKVSLEGNPWQCPCWNEMTNWLQERSIFYVRPQSPYFKGQKPLCVVTPVDFCVRNLRLVKEHKIEEIYNSGR